MKRKSLAEEYAEFEKIIPANASKTQRVETKRAFYAGAQTLLFLLETGLDEDKEPTEADVQWVGSIAEELKQHARDIAEGRA